MMTLLLVVLTFIHLVDGPILGKDFPKGGLV